jgi:hypothetical protein
MKRSTKRVGTAKVRRPGQVGATVKDTLSGQSQGETTASKP